MKIRPVTEWTLYRLRFVAAYFVLAVIAATLLVLNITTVPPGIGPSEQQSVVTSAEVSFTQLPKDIIDVPYHALQKLSVDFFGLSPLGVRLPSLVFGALTALCAVLLLRRWFKPNVAAAAGLILVTAAWFLSFARLGAPIVMVPFWTSFLLLSATYVSQQTPSWRWWRVFFAMGTALSLYTPGMIYLFVAATLASIAQPHLRYLLREGNRTNLLIGGFFFAVLLVPLGWGLYHNPSQVWQLLGVPLVLPDGWQFGANLWAAASSFVNPFHTGIGEVVTPILGLANVALLLMGSVRLLRDFHSVRAHLLLIWAALLIPVIGLNPNSLAILFVPTMLVVTIGLNQIIRYWYRLFPLNPYARVFGVLPLVIMLFSIVQFNYERYMFGMLYSPQAAAIFNRDPYLAQSETTSAKGPVTLVVDDKAQPLYKTVRGNNVLVTTAKDAPADRAGTWIVAEASNAELAPKLNPGFSHLVVTDAAKNGLRYWVYQR
jgi:hypothetical protein